MSEMSFRELLHKTQKKTQEIVRTPINKRKSKHAPKEISSKIPASKLKPVKFYKTGEDPESGVFVKKYKPRDPRFEKYAGTFNQGLFEASYSFLDEYREKELEDIQNAMQGAGSEDLLELYKRKKQEINRLKDEKREAKVKRELIKEEKEKVKTGKKPYFFKKRVVKMLALKEKIKELKERGEYEEYRRKKRKRSIYEQKFSGIKVPKRRE